MRKDPHQKAEHLVQKHGIDGALKATVEGVAAAQSKGDNYDLSVWREVKRILKEKKDDS